MKRSSFEGVVGVGYRLDRFDRLVAEFLQSGDGDRLALDIGPQRTLTGLSSVALELIKRTTSGGGVGHL